MGTSRANRMRLADLHFRPQSEFGSLKIFHYDIMAFVSSLADDMEAILTSLGLWEEYGASGWGVNGDMSFKDHKGRNVGVKGTYETEYTPLSISQVHSIYREDYVRFGFSTEIPDQS